VFEIGNCGGPVPRPRIRIQGTALGVGAAHKKANCERENEAAAHKKANCERENEANDGRVGVEKDLAP
jgi:hypothetical protein